MNLSTTLFALALNTEWPKNITNIFNVHSWTRYRYTINIDKHFDYPTATSSKLLHTDVEAL